MKKLIFALLLSVMSLSTFADEQPVDPWSALWGRFMFTNDGVKLENAKTTYAFFGKTFAELEDLIARKQGMKTAKISPEMVWYYMGATVMSQSQWNDDLSVLEEDDADATAMFEKSKNKTLSYSDFRGPRWVHVIQSLDLEEKNCLAISVVNGKIGGCGDVWQGGLTSDEVVCFKDKTYIKCHIDCMDKIYNRTAEVEPGFCPAKAE